MPHVIEAATSARAKCRSCGGKIAAGERRFGERLPNPYADDGGEMTQWFHLPCAAFRRPESFLDTLEASSEPIENREQLAHEARLGIAHRRLPRVGTAERAPTGRANCRACKTPIEKDTWRLALVFYEDGRFVPSGFMHATCATEYLETTEIMPRVRHFSPGLSEEDLGEIETEANAPEGTR
jgi:hypothetical protein